MNKKLLVGSGLLVFLIIFFALGWHFNRQAFPHPLPPPANTIVSADLSFATPTLLSDKFMLREPGISGSKGTGDVWMAGGSHGLPASLWKSTDGGKSFQPMLMNFLGKEDIAGGDRDVLVDNSGVIHYVTMAGQNANSQTAYYYLKSSDNGQNFTALTGFGDGTFSPGMSTSLKGGINVDRPWLAHFDKNLYIFYRCVQGICVDISRDNGDSFTEHDVAISRELCACDSRSGFSYFKTIGNMGYVALDPRDGTIYIPYATVDPKLVIPWTTYFIAISKDGGKTFSHNKITKMIGGPGEVWMPITIDKEGNVYLVWGQTNWNGDLPMTLTTNIYFSISSDQGLNWSQPDRITRGGKNIFPWAVAGDRGRLAISWWQTNQTSPMLDAYIKSCPYCVPQDAKWYMQLAISTNALDKDPKFLQTQVSGEPMFTGPFYLPFKPFEINPASSRPTPHDYLADFSEISINKDGGVDVVWDSIVSMDNKRAVTLFTRQKSGPKLYGQ